MSQLIGQHIEKADTSVLAGKGLMPIINRQGKIIALSDGHGRPYKFVRFHRGEVREQSDYADINYNALIYTD